MKKIGKPTQENVSVSDVKSKKVCILGYAPHLKEAPFQDESWEMWGINSLYRQLPNIPLSRFSAWFEIHSVEFLANRQDKKAVQAHFKALSEMKMPLYMKDHYDLFPASIKYPLDEVVKADYSLNPGRYVGTQVQENKVDFDSRIKELTSEFENLTDQARKIEEKIFVNFKKIK